MKQIVYSIAGDSSVLHETSAATPSPGEGEVRVRVAFSGVNPTDWKSRQDGGEVLADQIPNQDGGGVIEAVGAGVPKQRVGQRVWLWESAHQRRWGTAAEQTLVRADRAVPLPDGIGLDAAAALPIPAMTAHRALTAGENVPDRLAPGSLSGRTVLVQGGAGAVGHAAIQLARWAGASVIATVSSDAKAQLATAAGAHHTVDYTRGKPAETVSALAPDGVDVIVEVAPAANAEFDVAVLAPQATVAVYADAGGEMQLPVRRLMSLNARWQFVLVYTEPDAAKANAVADITAALVDGALPVGTEHGLPLLVFPLERTGEAHDAVQNGFVGKVLISVDPPGGAETNEGSA